MLPQAVQREGDREDEEDREHVGPPGGGEAKGPPEDADGPEMEEHRHATLASDTPLEIRRIGCGLATRRAEIDGEQSRRAGQEFVPPLVDLRRQMVTLGVVVLRSELGVMIEVPLRELRRRNSAGSRVEKAEDAFGNRAPAAKIRW